MPGDPLFDTLFRSTTAAPPIASAAPVPTRGTRSRAGNAMNRTRAAILDGARRAVEISGTRITMAQVAAAAGVAKATLYNHFRTREAVLAALLQDEIASLLDDSVGQPITDAIAAAAVALAEHPLLRALARVEPATLAALARVDLEATGWRAVGDAIDVAYGAEFGAAKTLVMRWIASYMITPASAEAIAAELDLLLSALPPAVAPRPPRDAVMTPEVRAQSA